jgi:hypothetical protein
MTYPVQLDVTSPLRFDRAQLALRVVVAIALGCIGMTGSWLTWLLFLVLPVFAAIGVSTRGARRYLDELGPGLWRVLTWLLAFSAYMLLLTDRFPTGEPTGVQVEIQVDGQPTVGSALVRLLTSIPSGIVLGLLGIVSWVLILVGAGMILIEGRVPFGILGFQRGILRWQARLLAYHASLVEDYPPFSFEDTHQPRPGDRASMA